MSDGGFRADLNGLRGISVLLVVAFHLQLKGAGGGFIGVDVFFVISGYLMTRIVCNGLADDSFSYWRFVCARAARIWPALAALVVLLFGVGAWLLPPFDLELLAEQARWALLFASNHHFLERTGYITHAGDTLWLLHTWSLSVEWQFYLVYPLMLMAVARRRHLMVGMLVLLALLSLALQLAQSRSHADASFFLLPGRCWEFLAGGLVFFTPPSRAYRVLASYAGLALVLGSALAIALLRLRSVGLGPWLLLPVAGTALILWSDHADSLVLRNPVLQRLGLWSYSIYLWHWPIIIGLRMTEYPLEYPRMTMAFTVMASVAMGWLSYTLVERPRFAFKPALALLLGAGVVSVATATEGFSFRQRQVPDFYRGYWASIQPLYFPDSCSNFKKPAAEMKPCPIPKGTKGTPARTLVIGDSHAEHLYAWLVANSPRSVDFFTASECPPVPGFERMQPGYDCQGYAVLAWREALSVRYDTVIVSARWATVGLAGAPYCHQQGERCVRPASVPAKQALVRAELKAAVAAALKAGKTVVMVDAAPESRFRVPERLAREQFWYGSTRLSVPRSVVDEQAAWLAPLLDELRDTPAFHRVSLRDALCDATTCRVYDAKLNRPVFLDESHFDPVWIAQQTDLFAPFVSLQRTNPP